jgi:flagellar biogenesis protein FliO
MDSAWRIVWALPLVLTVGAVAALILRRFLLPMTPAGRSAQRLRMCESLTLSDETRVHLIEVDGAGYLLVESTRHAVLQSALAATSEAARAAPPLRPAWLQRFATASRR